MSLLEPGGCNTLAGRTGVSASSSDGSKGHHVWDSAVPAWMRFRGMVGYTLSHARRCQLCADIVEATNRIGELRLE